MRRVIITAIIFLLPGCLSTLAQNSTFSSYDDYYAQVNKLEEQGLYERALELVESVKDQFPDKQFEISQEYIYLYTKTEQYEKCFDVWEEGHERGYFYLLNTRMPRYAPFLEFERFTTIAETDARLREEALANSSTIYEVDTPDGYSKEKKYPLLLILHGGGSSIERARKHWKSDKLKEGFIVAFLQSYLHYDYKTYGWRRFDPRAREDIKNCYDDILKKYAVDTSAVIIGGVSAGGTAAFDIAFNRILPISGLIGVCTGKPDEFDSTRVETAKNADMIVFMLSGENDHYLPRQQEMIKLFENAGLAFKFEVIEGMGHEYPDDFSSRLDSALGYITGTGTVD